MVYESEHIFIEHLLCASHWIGARDTNGHLLVCGSTFFFMLTHGPHPHTLTFLPIKGSQGSAEMPRAPWSLYWSPSIKESLPSSISCNLDPLSGHSVCITFSCYAHILWTSEDEDHVLLSSLYYIPYCAFQGTTQIKGTGWNTSPRNSRAKSQLITCSHYPVPFKATLNTTPGNPVDKRTVAFSHPVRLPSCDLFFSHVQTMGSRELPG